MSLVLYAQHSLTHSMLSMCILYWDVCIYMHLTDLCQMRHTCLAEHDKQLGGLDEDPWRQL